MLSNMYFIDWYYSLANNSQAVVTIAITIVLSISLACAVRINKKEEKKEFIKFVEDYYAGRLNFRGGRIK